MIEDKFSSGLRIGVDARNLTASMTGIGRYICELSRELSEAGHDVVLYMPEEPKTSLKGLTSCRTRISRMRGPILRQVWAHTILPARVRCDSLDVFWGPAHRLPPFLPESLPRVVTIHDLVWLHAPETMRKRTRLGEQAFMKRSVSRADLIVTDSDATACDLAAAIPDLGKRVFTVYPGVTALPAGIDVDVASIFGINKPYVFFVGTLEPRKNLLRLLDAWKLLPASLREAWLLVIAGGKGWGMDNLVHEVSSRGLISSVRHIGYVTDSQLSALYSNAKLLAMPSIYEGFGLPIVEANSRGVPVLTSNVSCMPEIAGPDAMYANPTSSQSIADALESVLSDSFRQKKLSDAAERNARRFDWRNSAHQLIEVFRNAVAARKRS